MRLLLGILLLVPAVTLAAGTGKKRNPASTSLCGKLEGACMGVQANGPANNGCHYTIGGKVIHPTSDAVIDEIDNLMGNGGNPVCADATKLKDGSYSVDEVEAAQK